MIIPPSLESVISPANGYGCKRSTAFTDSAGSANGTRNANRRLRNDEIGYSEKTETLIQRNAL
jgi:hypothetical protein